MPSHGSLNTCVSLPADTARASAAAVVKSSEEKSAAESRTLEYI